MTVPFTHLHTHTPEGSLLDGFMRIEKAIAKAKSLGMDALGVSDHGTMAAHDKFYRLCKEAGIHPVLGMESYLTYDKSFKKEDFEAVKLEQDDEGNHVFKFLMPDEIGEEFVPVRDFPTKKRQQEFQRMALKTYYLELVTDSLLPGEELPTKVNARNKLAKSIAKTYEDQGYVLCVKGDAAQRNFFQWFPRSGHLLLIAKNNEGYQNLIRLNNAGQLEGFYIKPRVDYSDIKKYGKGVICTTACLGSIPNQLILKGRLDEAKAEIQRYVEAFDEVYLEIQPGQTEEQQLVNRTLIQWSEELNLPLIATSDAHMVDYDELPLHETLTNIGGQSKDDNDVSVYEWTYLMSAKEMLDFGIPEIALTNAYELSHRCQVDFLEDRTAKFPVFDVPEGHNFDSYLSELAYQGVFDLFMRKDYIKDYTAYQDRLEYELGIIKDKQISAYFLIVHDYINWARSQGIYIGPGRGSAAGSLIGYVLKLTNIDPLKYNLLFERFLNPERMSLPDIDTDFSYQRRHEVIDYLIEKYGVEHIANIGTYSQMSSKSILKNVGKVMGVDFDVVNKWNKEIPSPGGSPLKLADAIETIPTIQQASKQYPKLFDLALELEKMPKSSGIHASGYQVAPNNLMFNLPLMPGKKGEIITQYEGPVLEDLGYIKFDILGLKNLSVFEMAHDLILERHGVDLDINELTPGEEPGDEGVFKMIQNGDTLGLFQIEGEGITQVFTGLKKVNFDTLIAGVALYRPGPMAHIPEYQARSNGEKEVTYLTPELEDILSTTHGIAIYQESIMQITQTLGGYTAGQADSFRKAIGKKSQQVMDVELPKLHQAILDNGYSEEIANEVHQIIEPFIGYGFNKSHAAAYAFVAYQCAYLKYHYPIEFFTALLSVFSDDKVKVSGYIQDAKAHGIDVLRPDINLSDIDFNIASDNEIRYGLGSIHGLKDLAVTSILGIRPVSSLPELFSQVEKKEVDKTSVNALALSGAFDSFGETEESNRMEILSKAWMARGDNNADTIQEMLTFNNAKKLAYEKKYLGLYLTGHPLEGVAKATDWSGFMESNNIVTAMGIVGTIKTIITKKGDPMAFVRVSFLEMEQDTVVFPAVWQSDVQLRKGSPILPLSSVLRPGLYVKVTGRFDADGGFLVNRFDIPLRLNAAFADDLAELEETEGEAVPVEAPIEAPRMVFDEMF